MIEINLLPEEQRAKTRKAVSNAPVNPVAGFDPTYLIYIVPTVTAILLVTHLYLGFVAFSKQSGIASANKEWAGLESQRQKITSYKSESEVNSRDAMIIDELTKKSIRWSEKLNRICLDLPPGVWFSEMVISRKSLEIKASAFSLDSNGVDLVNKFIFNLKNDRSFFNDFISVETGNMVTKRLGSYEVMDFSLSGVLKTGK
jgi:Tfp pilus assembly protein PilN